jgi:ribonuclease HI
LIHSRIATSNANGPSTAPFTVDGYPTVIHKGSSIKTTLTCRSTGKTFCIINLYLHGSDSNLWLTEIDSLTNYNHATNSIFTGDFNFTEHPIDRSSNYHNHPNAANTAFAKFVSQHQLQELHQKYHTFYRNNSNTNSVTSSRLDRFYHNLDYATIAAFTPSCRLDTTSNYTLSSYRHRYHNTVPSLTPNQYIHTFPNQDKGGTHITDHIPVGITFTSNLTHRNASTRFSSSIVNSPEFLEAVKRLWDDARTTGGPFQNLAALKKVFAAAHLEVRSSPHFKPDRDSLLWDAVRILHMANSAGKIDRAAVVEEFPLHLAIHTLLPLDGDSTALLDYVNTEFATNAYDSATKATADKLATISRSLPTTKKTVTTIKDNDDIITSDPVKVNKVLAKFWSDKWHHSPTHYTAKLFKIYNKRISCSPVDITEDFVHTVIANTNDSAVGPDDVPFEVYRVTAEISAPILLASLRWLMDGHPPPDDFNAGLLYVLEKKPTNLAEDTRPLVVNNTDNRIISTCIRESITPSVDSILSPDQHGFRAGMSVDSNIEFFNEKFYSAMDNERFYDIMLVDFKKAFDSVSHEAIFALIKQIGLPAQHCNAIQSLFNNAHCFTTTDRSNPLRIDFHSGVKQGCPLSPTLFILLMDVLHDMITSCANVHIRLYADDVAIGANNLIPHLPVLKRCFKIFAKATGLHLNAAKTVFVATGGRSQLRAALDNIGWSEMLIVGSTKYLGIPIGHSASLDDVFTPCHDKLVKRVSDYVRSGVKKNFSIPKRVQVWNTWLLPIYSFTSKFFLMPKDFLSSTDIITKSWLNKGNAIEGLQLSRPKHLLGITPALRDTYAANLAALISKASPRATNCSMQTWSMRISTQRILACIYANHNYSLNLKPGTTSTKVYSMLINSSLRVASYRKYIDKKCAVMGLQTADTTHLLCNQARAPSWLPPYARFNIVALTHNMMFTDARAHRSNLGCRFCTHLNDSTTHVFGNCPAVLAALTNIYNHLNLSTPPSNYFNHLVCAEPNVPPHVTALRTMLVNAIWRARTEAGHGKVNDNWSNWIAEDCLTRISKLNPNYFNTYFPGNSVHPRYKLTYKADIGSSAGTPLQKATARKVIATHIERLPTNTRYMFTDGSAKPNPGPAGAGVVIHNTDNHSKHIHAYGATIGLASNNVGEAIAIGMGIEICSADNYKGDIYIYTDSRVIHNALRYNHSAGVENEWLIQALKRCVRNYQIQNNSCIYFRWIPGHSGIPLNEVADALAGKGSNISKKNLINFNLQGFIAKFGFAHLIHFTNYFAPWANNVTLIKSPSNFAEFSQLLS